MAIYRYSLDSLKQKDPHSVKETLFIKQKEKSKNPQHKSQGVGYYELRNSNSWSVSGHSGYRVMMFQGRVYMVHSAQAEDGSGPGQ